MLDGEGDDDDDDDDEDMENVPNVYLNFSEKMNKC